MRICRVTDSYFAEETPYPLDSDLAIRKNDALCTLEHHSACHSKVAFDFWNGHFFEMMTMMMRTRYSVSLDRLLADPAMWLYSRNRKTLCVCVDGCMKCSGRQIPCKKERQVVVKVAAGMLPPSLRHDAFFFSVFFHLAFSFLHSTPAADRGV